MWRFIYAEMIYFKSLFGGIFISSILIAVYSANPNFQYFSPGVLMFWIGFFFLQYWLKNNKKENRELLLARLPCSLLTLALIRIGIIFLSLVFAGFIFAGLTTALHQSVVIGKHMIIPLGIVLSLFSFYYIISDWFVPFFNKIGLTHAKFKTLLIAVILVLNFLTILAVLNTRQGNPPEFIPAVEQFLIKNNPFTEPYALLKFGCFSLGLSGLTLLSFCFRKKRVL